MCAETSAEGIGRSPFMKLSGSEEAPSQGVYLSNARWRELEIPADLLVDSGLVRRLEG